VAKLADISACSNVDKRTYCFKGGMSDHPVAVTCIAWKYLEKAELIKLLVAVYGMENLALRY
jgi:hypothetical protein